MKTRTVISLLVLSMFVPVSVMGQKTESEGTISNTLSAACLVRITYDASVLPLQSDELYFLVTSSVVAGRAGQEVLGVPYQEIADVVTFEMTSPPTNLEPFSSSYREGMGGYGGGFGYLEMDPPITPPDPPQVPDENETKNNPPSEQGMSGYGMMGMGGGMGGGMGMMGGMTRGRYGTQSTGYRDVLGSSPSSERPVQQIFHLEVNLNEGMQPMAQEFMVATVELLRQALDVEYMRYRVRMEDRFAKLNQQSKNAQEELEKIKSDSGAIDTRPIYPSLEVLLNKRQDVQDKLERLELELARYEARRQAIMEQIAKARAEIDDKMKQDEVLHELEDILKIAATRLNAVEKLHQSGNTSAQSVDDAREKLVRARIELAQRRESIGDDAGGAIIYKYTQQLSEQEIRAVEIKAEFEAIEKQKRDLDIQIELAYKQQTRLPQIQQAQRKLAFAQQQRDTLLNALNNLTALEVSIIGEQ
ncbi:MAG: hypothetical protein JXA82_10475 [Sedimentisphaerales bacterium]|nr:hypothetical protein [Sedimentisphaerales bacterium]